MGLRIIQKIYKCSLCRKTLLGGKGWHVGCEVWCEKCCDKAIDKDCAETRWVDGNSMVL
jgi:hypothetical protein